MDTLKNTLGHLKTTISDELFEAKKLKGAKLEKICSDFCLNEDIIIYYNKFNLIFIRERDLNQVSPFLKMEDRVIKLDLPKSNVFLAIYQYFNSQVLENYIG